MAHTRVELIVLSQRNEQRPELRLLNIVRIPPSLLSGAARTASSVERLLDDRLSGEELFANGILDEEVDLRRGEVSVTVRIGPLP